jgi:hypothetical protein
LQVGQFQVGLAANLNVCELALHRNTRVDRDSLC